MRAKKKGKEDQSSLNRTIKKGVRKIANNKEQMPNPVEPNHTSYANIDRVLVNKTEVRVIYADTDAMQVVYHSNYFKWFEVGRTELLRSIGYPYARLEQEGFMLPVIECGCRYLHPARYDDILVITTMIEEVKAATIIIRYEIHRQATGQKLITGFTKHAVTNKNLKPVRLRNVAPDLHNIFSRELKL
jgi:acyl-CoA thioester hydrolase